MLHSQNEEDREGEDLVDHFALIITDLVDHFSEIIPVLKLKVVDKVGLIHDFLDQDKMITMLQSQISANLMLQKRVLKPVKKVLRAN